MFTGALVLPVQALLAHKRAVTPHYGATMAHGAKPDTLAHG